MSHHGWVDIINIRTVTPDVLRSPFGRLFAAQDHDYNSHAISLLAGGLGPMQERTLNGFFKVGTAEEIDSPSKGKGTNPAGFTFLGQFIDHDLTEFRVIGDDLALIKVNPTIGQRQIVLEDLGRVEAARPTTTNGRTGVLDLDSVYGLLGGAQPDLFTPDGLFIMAAGPDIERDSHYRNNRLIADPRNDENKLVVQVHMLFERLHNIIHDAKAGSNEDKGATGSAFLATRAEVVEVFHRIVLHDYLPRIVHAAHLTLVLERLGQRRTLYQAMNRRAREALKAVGVDELGRGHRPVAMPVEFSHAAFRLGHSQLLNGYLLRVEDGNPVAVPLFNTGGGARDLRGNQPLVPDGSPSFLVDWGRFFKIEAADPQHGNPIDGTLPDSVFRLPPPTIGEPPVSLAERNIRRGIDFGLPSGQEAAAALAEVYGYIPATARADLFPEVIHAQVPEVRDAAGNLQWETPLWYYILMEAGHDHSGPQLGPVGGLIVAETILGSIVEQRRRSGETLAAIVTDLQDSYADNPPVAGVDELTSGDLAWNKALNGTADIFTMSQLVRYVQAGGGSVPAPVAPEMAMA